MAINESCTSKQTFCVISSQIASQYDNNLSLTYTPNTIQNTQITDTIWNSVINKIVQIYNYGQRGTRNPTQPFGINNFVQPSDTNTTSGESVKTGTISDSVRNEKYVNDNDIINLNNYNSILTTVGLLNLNHATDNLIITAEKFNTILNKINELTFDSTRCNDCNVGCNVKCKASDQCDSSCDGSCPGFTCYGCSWEGGDSPCYIECSR